MVKLMVGLARILFLCVLLLALPSPAASQQPRVMVDRVWTQDGNGNDKATFNPGDAIRYTTTIRNPLNRPVKMWIRFEAGGPIPHVDPFHRIQRDIYLYQQREVIVPAGLAGYYSPSTILATDQPGEYFISVSICYDETSVTTGTRCSGIYTSNEGRFSIPGNLATKMTSFLPDGVTSTSAVGVDPGAALVYKITVTNTSSVNNTGVILTDLLPREIFAIIATPTSPRTDHGSCSTVGSWPSATLACLLGRLAPDETATISFTASIIFRNPDGSPRPPDTFVNKVYVRSDQQSFDTSASVETLVNSEELFKCEDFQDLAAAAKIAAGVIIGNTVPFGGLAWSIAGGIIPTTCQPKPFPEIPKDLSKLREGLVNAIGTHFDELIFIAFEQLAEWAGMPNAFPGPGTMKDLADAFMRYQSKHN
jgi:uncharacterized repeat protein (TIGR01451 family)